MSLGRTATIGSWVDSDTKSSMRSEIRSLQDLYTFRIVLALKPLALCDMLKVLESHSQSLQRLCSLPQMKNTLKDVFHLVGHSG